MCLLDTAGLKIIFELEVFEIQGKLSIGKPHRAFTQGNEVNEMTWRGILLKTHFVQ